MENNKKEIEEEMKFKARDWIFLFSTLGLLFIAVLIGWFSYGMALALLVTSLFAGWLVNYSFAYYRRKKK